MSLFKKLQIKPSNQTKTSFKYLLLTSVNTFKLNTQSIYLTNKLSRNIFLSCHENIILTLRQNLKKLFTNEATTNNRIKFIRSSALMASFSKQTQTSSHENKFQFSNTSTIYTKGSKRILNFNKKLDEKSKDLIEKILFFYKNFINKLQNFKFNFEFSNFGFNRKYFVTLAASCGIFTWDEYKIKDDDIKNEVNEILTLFNLPKDNTNDSAESEPSSHQVKINIDAARKIENDEWKLIYDKKDLLIWRRSITLDNDDDDIEDIETKSKTEKPNYDLFEYKVLGRFNDITPVEFYQTQTDLEFRKEWDYLALSLNVISIDPLTKTELVKWIMKFPYPLYPRMYVYIRRYCIDPDEKLMILVSKSIPNINIEMENLTNTEIKEEIVNKNLSANEKYVRVTKYKSNIIVLPHGDFDKPGLDYVIQYYDINKAKIPKLAYKWMATSGLPDYLDKVHKAAVMLKHRNGSRHTDESSTLKQFEILYLNKKPEDNIKDEQLVDEIQSAIECQNGQSAGEIIIKSEINEDVQSKTQNDKDDCLVANEEDDFLRNFFFLIIQKMYDDFFSQDEPHPIFYN
ncbi:unnamed protein product [Brachionus calyciflorus]|uniref:START domain-containing protein n=1 Tax=Brachionus calyciflorus TaxID=104777 RepID=A0A813NNK3_9BILA|nr:unnamed protein product [Brachionus calyciflorus]